MKPDLSVLEKLQTAYGLVADVLGQAPQLYDLHLDQALLVLVLAMKRVVPVSLRRGKNRAPTGFRRFHVGGRGTPARQPQPAAAMACS